MKNYERKKKSLFSTNNSKIQGMKKNYFVPKALLGKALGIIEKTSNVSYVRHWETGDKMGITVLAGDETQFEELQKVLIEEKIIIGKVLDPETLDNSVQTGEIDEKDKADLEKGLQDIKDQNAKEYQIKIDGVVKIVKILFPHITDENILSLLNIFVELQKLD